jgi:hypothetical protein
MESKENFNQDWSVGEHIDCIDETGKWCNAEIIKVRNKESLLILIL